MQALELWLFGSLVAGQAHGELHIPLHNPQLFSVHTQAQNDQTCGGCNPSLRAKGVFKPMRLDPVDLNVRRHEAAHISSHNDPCTDFARPFWVGVKEVGVDGNSGNHNANDLRGEEDGYDRPRPRALEREAED